MLKAQVIEKNMGMSANSPFRLLSLEEGLEPIDEILKLLDHCDLVMVGEHSRIADHVERAFATLVKSKLIGLVSFRRKADILAVALVPTLARELLPLVLNHNLGLAAALVAELEMNRGKGYVEVELKESDLTVEKHSGSSRRALLPDASDFMAAEVFFKANVGEVAIITGDEQSAAVDRNVQEMVNVVIHYLNHAAYLDAVLLIDVILQARPDQHQFYFVKALAQQQLGSQNDAIESLESLLKMNPAHEQGRSLYEQLLASQGGTKN